MRFGPWLTFAATVTLIAWLASTHSGPTGVIGFAEGDTLSIGPTDSARVLTVAVEVGQEVAAGQVLATLDTGALDAELAVAEAEWAALEAKLAAERVGAAKDERTELGELEATLERARISVAKEEESYLRADTEREALDAERRRIRALLDDGLATRQDLARIDVKCAAAKQKAEGQAETLRMLREQLRGAIERRDQMALSGDIRVAVEPLRKQIEIVNRRIDGLKRQRADATLHAPTPGRVTGVLKRPGETAGVDSPVITMVREHVDRVVACVTEYDALAVHDGEAAVLQPRDGTSSRLTGRVISLGPMVEELPARCQRSPLVRAWGRDVVVLLDQSSGTVPGQAFYVSFVSDRRSAGEGSANAAQSADHARLMSVPPELALHSRFEPSGVSWQPELLRYLVVSDDTGVPAAFDHAPWLFTMAVDGSVDPAPVAVMGVPELNDLEAVTKDIDGTVYVLSSQSYSKSGARHSSRTAFLRLQPRERSYDVTGELHIAEALDAADPSVLTRLGIPSGTRELEIEGLSMHAGAAYFGLKAPLDAAGRAMIWRLPDVRAAFDRGRIDVDRIELWASVPLSVEADHREVPGGVSDLLFLPDGSLLIATTPSDADATAESGSVVHVSDPQPGVLEPRTVRSFAGLRPEGLSIAPTPGRFLVVFDAGEGTPSWIELPWSG